MWPAALLTLYRQPGRGAPVRKKKCSAGRYVVSQNPHAAADAHMRFPTTSLHTLHTACQSDPCIRGTSHMLPCTYMHTQAQACTSLHTAPPSRPEQARPVDLHVNNCAQQHACMMHACSPRNVSTCSHGALMHQHRHPSFRFSQLGLHTFIPWTNTLIPGPSHRCLPAWHPTAHTLQHTHPAALQP